MLSKYQFEIIEDHDFSLDKKVQILSNKTKYKFRYWSLKLYLNLVLQ